MITANLKDFLILKNKNVVEAMRKIDSNAKGILFVVDNNRKLLGVVTDGDIRRWLLATGNLNESVEKIMNCNPKVIYRKDMKSAQKEMKRYVITALPVVSTEYVITDIIFREYPEDGMELNMADAVLKKVPVVVMAGGVGSRLYPYTKILPKPLIPIGDVPIMERIIEKFKENGAGDFYATLNYRKEMIKSYFSELPIGNSICYIEEDKPLGTAGSLNMLNGRLKVPFFVTNCDIIIYANYADIYNYHMEAGNEITLVAALKNVRVPYGVVRSGANGKVTQIEEKPEMSYFVNTGMYILNPQLLDDIPKDTPFHMTDLIDLLLKQDRKVGMYPISEDSFLDMGEIEEMKRMEEKIR